MSLRPLLLGIAFTGLIATTAVGDKVHVGTIPVKEQPLGSIGSLEARALHDPSYCGRPKESVTYTCRFKDSTWAMCMMPSGQNVLRQVRGGKIVKRIYTHEGNVAATDIETPDGPNFHYEVRYSIQDGPRRYTIFSTQTSADPAVDRRTSGLIIEEPGKPTRRSVCPQAGDLQFLNSLEAPTVFSNVLED